MFISHVYSSFQACGMLLLAASMLSAQDPSKIYPTIGTIERVDPALDALLPADAKIEVLASGFEWTEGPVWVPDLEGGVLLFSEIPSNSVRLWSPKKDGVRIYLQPSGYTGPAEYSREPGSNGLALNAKGELVSCEHGDRRLSVLTKGGGKRTLADHFEGKRFNSPNDLTIAKNGDIYFTDPIYGLPKGENDPARELDHCGVYRWSAADGKVTLLTTELKRPNGIAFSPDEKTLYVAQSDRVAIWMAYPVKEDGTLEAGKVLRDVSSMMGQYKGAPDGMKVDAAGNLWATGPGGVHIMDATGKLLGRIDTTQNTSNVAFGAGYLYITADMYVCRVKLK